MNALFLKLLNMSISASWLILAVLLLRHVLKRAPKWAHVLLWGMVAVRLLCPVSIESVLSLIPSTETIPMNIEMDATPAIDSGIDVINRVVNPVISASFTPQPAASANPLQIWIPVTSWLWIAGMVGMFLYTAISYWCLRRKVATAVRYRGNIFQSEHIQSPFVLGIVRPGIYLPYCIAGEDRNYVIAHEQAHIRRKDHWWKPLGFLLLTVHWFNPLMWLAYVLLCRDIELACDEKVIKDLGSQQRADYTQALVTCSVSRRAIAACPLAFGEVSVKERVKSILHYRKPTFWLVVLAVVCCVAVAVCFLTNPVNGTRDWTLFRDHESKLQQFVPAPVSEATLEELLGPTYTAVGCWDFSSFFQIESGEDSLSPGAMDNISGPVLAAELRKALQGEVFTAVPLPEGEKNYDAYMKSLLQGEEKQLNVMITGGTQPPLTIAAGQTRMSIVQLHSTDGKRYYLSVGYQTEPEPKTTYYAFYSDNPALNAKLNDFVAQAKALVGTHETTSVLEGTILEIQNGYFLVEPVAGSEELNSADRIEVPMKNMAPGLEPQVGDLIQITYDGQILETYPARLHTVYHILVLREAEPVLSQNNTASPEPDRELMIDPVAPVTVVNFITGEEKIITSNEDIRFLQLLIPEEWAEGDPGCDYDFKVTINGVAYAYHSDCGTVTDIERHCCFTLDAAQKSEMDRILTGEAQQIHFPAITEETDRFYLTIGAEGVTYIEISMPYSSGGCQNADGSAFRKGEQVWLENLDGYTDLRGLEITAMNREGEIVWSAAVPNTQENTGLTRLTQNDWTITNLP